MGHFMASQVTGTIKFKEEAAESEDCGLQGESWEERRRIRETKRKKKKKLMGIFVFPLGRPTTNPPTQLCHPPATHTHAHVATTHPLKQADKLSFNCPY